MTAFLQLRRASLLVPVLGLWILCMVGAGAASPAEPSAAESPQPEGVLLFDVALRPAAAAGEDRPLGRCKVELRPTTRDLRTRCRHLQRGFADLFLVRRGDDLAAAAVAGLGGGASPIDLSTTLAPEVAEELAAGALDLLLRGADEWGGPLVATLVDPIFLSDFETAGLCEWSNVGPPCVDGNVCTDDDCDPFSGVCSHPFNSASCTLPNATGICSGGDCSIDSCNSGYSNCDGNPGNGCEVAHGTSPNSCASAIVLGFVPGDTNCGVSCSSVAWSTSYQVTNVWTSKWFKVTALEASATCSAPIENRVRLTVPPNVNYDLFLYMACGSSAAVSSTNDIGQAEEAVISTPDTGASDSFAYWIEVRYVSGASCTPWTLYIDGHACS